VETKIIKRMKYKNKKLKKWGEFINRLTVPFTIKTHFCANSTHFALKSIKKYVHKCHKYQA
jgi:hypothetical protein